MATIFMVKSPMVVITKMTVVLSNQNSDIITNYFCPPFPSCIETSSINEFNYCDNGTDWFPDDNTDGVVLWNNCFFH